MAATEKRGKPKHFLTTTAEYSPMLKRSHLNLLFMGAMMQSVNINIPAVFIGLFGSLVTFAVYQLKPTNLPTFANTALPMPIERQLYDRADIAGPAIDLQEKAFAVSASEPEHLSENYQQASLLNSLMFDFFTTSFDQNTQEKWQRKLSQDSHYLSELAQYLKLDKLFNMDLYLDENRRLETSMQSFLADDEQASLSLFELMDAYSDDFWPMNLVAQATWSSPSLKLLLNNFDRDFVLKIEKKGLANELAPLALGIERLLTFHLAQSVESNAGLRNFQVSGNINNVVRAFKKQAPATADLFSLYNLLVQKQWDEAARLLASSEALAQPKYYFLVHLLAINSPASLLKTVTNEQFHRNENWWRKFLTYELCVNQRFDDQWAIDQRLSVSIPCVYASNHSWVPSISDARQGSPVVQRFLQQILTKRNLTEQDIDQFLAVQPNQDHATLFALSSHALLNELASVNQLKALGDSYTFQQLEYNFQLWRSTLNAGDQDSFYLYTPIHHWFSRSVSIPHAKLHEQMSQLIPQLSISLQKAVARQLLTQIEGSVVLGADLHYYQALLPVMPEADYYRLQRLSRIAPDDWPVLNPIATHSPITLLLKNKYDNQVIEILYNTQSQQHLMAAATKDDYLFDIAVFMKDFSARFANTPMAQKIDHSFDAQGQLKEITIRLLEQRWLQLKG